MYKDVERTSDIFLSFAILAIIVACLGLFGLAEFTTKERTKEIGIRKVNGAKINEILLLLNIKFIRWIVIAFIIASPVAWYAANLWLQNFAYHTSVSWWIFALTSLLTIGIAMLTVCWQSWKAATRNPVESLRYE
jgi:putative ABC transport system permease protein